MKPFDLCLTYDDVLLVPQRSNVQHRTTVKTETFLTRNIKLNIPFVSSNMDTVTESVMAIALAHSGGIGIIHRFNTIERQVAEVKKVKRHEGFIIYKPYTLPPEATVREAKEQAQINNVDSFIVVDKEDFVLGIVTRRDMLFKNEKETVKNTMTEFSHLIYAKPNIGIAQARNLLIKHHIEKLPLIDKNRRLRALITSRSLEHFTNFSNSTKDSYGRLRVGAAIGVIEDFIDRATRLVEAGVDVLVIDVAHGHNEVALKAVAKIRKKFKDIDLIGGNVATPEGTRDLIQLEVDGVKVGIGPGGLCTTRIVAGVGVPQFSAVYECSRIGKKYKVPIIADGGTNYPGDVTKALAAGASTCMLAGWFAGTDESPGGIILRGGLKYKAHRGAASFLAVADRKMAANEMDENKLNTVVAEGVETMIPYKGKVSDVIYQLLGALRSGMSYMNAKTIADLHKNAFFVRITEAGFRESKSHNVKEL